MASGDTKQLAQRALERLNAGALAEACELFTRLCELDQRNAWCWMVLGAILAKLGQLERAEACLRRALDIRPAYPEAHYNLGDVLRLKGDLAQSLLCIDKAVEFAPEFVQAWFLRSWLRLELGDLPAAESDARRALELEPTMPEAHYTLGNVRQRQKKWDEALSAYRRALELRPQFPDAYFQMGNTQAASGRLNDAVTSFSRAIRLDLNLFAAHKEQAIIFLKLGKPQEAIGAYRRALAIQPNDALAWTNLGNALLLDGQVDESEKCLRHAIKLDSSNAAAHNNLGNTLKTKGKVTDAIACYRRTLELEPDSVGTHSNLLLSLNYLVAYNPTEVRLQHKMWEQAHSLTVHREHDNALDPERRLRIGYVSADFRIHAVANFIEALLRCRDASQFEVICYAEVMRPDGVTARMKGCVDGWCNTCGLTDEQLVKKIRHDRIDILVDLGGHTANSRLRVFTAKPAPIQVSYIGYVNTSGLSTIDYRITDRITDPPGAEQFYTEKLIYLNTGFSCYTPPEMAPEVSSLPAFRNGFITFGSLSNLFKINDRVIDLWCRVLRGVPSARMLVFRHILKGTAQQMLYESFEKRGIARDRITLSGEVPRQYLELPYGVQHLGFYEEIDITLDTFPWNGHTISCESLWMGVPVITLLGERHAGRIGASVMSQIGLPNLVADTPDVFIDIATRMAVDVDGLNRLRHSLRARMRNSPLCNGKEFTRNFESVYRTMWRDWCRGKKEY